MKIGVISDTHDRLPTFAAAVNLLRQQQVQAILHAGDYVAPFAAKLIAADVLEVPLHCIYGNNDGERNGLKQVLPGIVDGPMHLTLARRRIVMHHFIDWLTDADTADAELIITGHTHQVGVEQRQGKTYLNPGECCGWLTGRCTIATVDLPTMTTQIIEIPK